MSRHDILKREGLIRTDLYCHNCNSNFTAVINHDLDGNHEIECPRCGHYHYRVIKGGIVTSDRYDSDHRTHVVEKRDMWKSTTQPIVTSTATAFMRDLWLNREG